MSDCLKNISPCRYIGRGLVLSFQIDVESLGECVVRSEEMDSFP